MQTDHATTDYFSPRPTQGSLFAVDALPIATARFSVAPLVTLDGMPAKLIGNGEWRWVEPLDVDAEPIRVDARTAAVVLASGGKFLGKMAD